MKDAPLILNLIVGIIDANIDFLDANAQLETNAIQGLHPQTDSSFSIR